MPARRTILRAALATTVALAAAACTQVSLAEQIAALMREANQALVGKRYDEALGKLVQVVRLDPKHWPAYVGMARAFIGKGAWGDAVKNAREAFALAPSGQDVVAVFAEALIGGGKDALAAGRWSDAIGYLVDYIKLAPNSASAYLDLGRAFLSNRQYSQALDALLKGLGLAGQPGAPDRSEYLRTLLDGGRQAFQASDWSSAAGFLREYVKSDRGNVQAWLDLARSYWNAGDRTQALEAFRDVLKLAPTNAEALRFMLQQR